MVHRREGDSRSESTSRFNDSGFSAEDPVASADVSEDDGWTQLGLLQV
jgi:hypothetical protein